MAELTGRQLGLTAVRGRLLLPSEVAPLMRVSERWVEDHMNKVTFPVRWYPINPKRRLVDSEDLNDWLKKIRVEGGDAKLPVKAKKKIMEKEVIAQ